MRHTFLLTLYLILFCSSVFSQNCPPNDQITFLTQEQIDNFATDYPGCTELNYLEINSLAILNLNGLSQLTSVNNILIQFTDIQNLNGLQNIIEVKEELHIFINDNLIDISALSNLNTAGNIVVYSNYALTNLNGLQNITNLTNNSTIEIAYNISLSDISALNILPYYSNIDALYLNDNPNLSTCSNEGICHYIASGRQALIYDNLVGCNSSNEVLSACGVIPPVCPPGDITITSQVQIDSFVANYPTCVRIYGNFNISSVSNLDTLSEMRIVDGNLNICDNPSLTNLNGLADIQIKGDFIFKNNDAITEIEDRFNFNGGVYVEDNDALVDILDMTYYMLDVDYIRIANNPNLSLCGAGQGSFDYGICGYLAQNNPAEIFNNALGCNSVDEVQLNCVFLPITLTDFQAKIENKTTLLTWQTATESNNAGFEIQRSTDATNWEKIAWQDGQGTTTNAHTYTYRDENPLFGTSYYRLKQVDFDGAFEYTHIVQVNYEGRDISIYPNPVKNTLHIADLNGESIQHVSIYDQTGRAIFSRQMPDNTVDVSSLLPGMYIVKIAVEGEIFCRKFIVQERK